MRLLIPFLLDDNEERKISVEKVIADMLEVTRVAISKPQDEIELLQYHNKCMACVSCFNTDMGSFQSLEYYTQFLAKHHQGVTPVKKEVLL